MPPPSQWGIPTQHRHSETSFHFYVVLGLAIPILLVLHFVRTLQRRRREEAFDPALDDLDLEASSGSLDADQMNTTDGINNDPVFWDEGPGSLTSMGGSSRGIPDRPRDDTYEAAVASLISLESSSAQRTSSSRHGSDSDSHRFLQYRVRDVRKFQRLVEKLRNASYLLSENGPGLEGDPSRRREIEDIRMQIAELVVDPARRARRPTLQVYTEPPPAYHDVVSDPDVDARAQSQTFLPPPLSPRPISVSAGEG